MSYYRSSASGMPALPLLLAAAMIPLMLMSEDIQEDSLIDAMSAENANGATRKGMMKKLAPYFAVCQHSAGIPAGAQSGVTRAQAETAEACLFRAHENDPERTGNITAPIQRQLDISNAESLDEAMQQGLFDYLGAHWETCRAQLRIDPGTAPAQTRADHEGLEACLYTAYEDNLKRGAPAP